ncbi:MAG: 5'-nucleosidase [Gammaproteobacteria bacterium]|nr:5'-nucleosidase [Gammaproteobacteria bacterium]
MALALEGQGAFERDGVAVLYTGLGKINAALTLGARLAEYRVAGQPPPLVLNFGSAGSRRFATGSLVACERFVQRDMDVSGLGYPLGVTPFEEDGAEIVCAPVFPAPLPRAVCGSGDSFETGAPRLACDIVDMEAYALAKACRRAGAAFGCAKYVTDGADHAAASDWQANLGHAAAAFVRLYATLRRPATV